MKLTEIIKNLFKRNPKKEGIKQIPVDTKFQHNRFKNIKIYAPDYVMSSKSRYQVQGAQLPQNQASQSSRRNTA